MESSVKQQIIATLRYAPLHWAASHFKRSSSLWLEDAKRKLGGFIKGICRPGENYG